MKIYITRIDKTLPIPKHAKVGDAGVDLYCAEKTTVKPKDRAMISTGVKLAFEEGYVALIWDKSGLAAKQGLTNLAGVIDATYRGEYKVVVYNSSDTSYTFEKGDKVAQVLFQKHETAKFEEVDELPPSIRNEDSFGSTGK